VISEDIEVARSLAQYAVQAPDYYASQSETRVLARAVLTLMNQLDVYEARAVCAEHGLTPEEHRIGPNTFGGCSG
jgi:hypothetical protein